MKNIITITICIGLLLASGCGSEESSGFSLGGPYSGGYPFYPEGTSESLDNQKQDLDSEKSLQRLSTKELEKQFLQTASPEEIKEYIEFLDRLYLLYEMREINRNLESIRRQQQNQQRAAKPYWSFP